MNTRDDSHVELEEWRAACEGEIAGHDRENDMFISGATLAEVLGYEHFGIEILSPVPFFERACVIFSNFDDKWWERYQGLDVAVKSVFTAVRRRNSRGEDFYDYKWKAGELDEMAAGHQLELSTRVVRRGPFLSDWTFVFGSSSDKSQAGKVGVLCEVLCEHMGRRILPKMLPATISRLSDTEIAVLRMTLDGKSYEIVKEHLKLSRRKGESVKTNLQLKFDSQNLSYIAAVALKLRMLD